MLSSIRICIDGMNLALSKGTGVATYGATLAQLFFEAKNPVDLLYGQDMPLAVSSGDIAKVLCEGIVGNYKSPRPRFYDKKWWIENSYHIFGHSAEKIFLDSDAVSSFPPCQNLYNIPALFRAAHGFFRTTGMFVKVKPPGPIDIMHWTYPVPIRMVGVKNIYTIHDLVPLIYPRMTLDKTKTYEKMIKTIVSTSDGICTVSENSKKDVEKLFPDSMGKVFNTYQAHLIKEDNVENNFYEIRKHIAGMDFLEYSEYYIYYGQIEPKKNTARLIEAFLDSNSRRKLLLVGSTGWKNADVMAILRKGLELGRVIHIPYLPSKYLFALLRNARALLFPSLIEGFGLPLLEAFTLGTPVLTSNMGALQEVAGNAAMLVNPFNVSSIRDAIDLLDISDALCLELSMKGKERSDFFSIAAYRNRLEQFYEVISRK